MCPTKRYNRNNDLHKIFNTARIAQTETHNSSRLNVGHGANASFPNLRPVITKKQKCRLGTTCMDRYIAPCNICIHHLHVDYAGGKATQEQLPKALACPTKHRHQQGTSYIEIMTVVFILALIAGVAIPNLASNDHRKLDIAAEEIVQAIRFARLEAIRTANPSGVEFNSTNDTVKVYSLAYSEVFGIPVWTPTFNVYHPVDKKLYTLNLKSDAATEGVELQSYGIYYGGSGFNNPSLDFNVNGNPKYSFLGTDSMLDSATITLSYAGETRVISISPMTGRVTVQ